MTAWLTRLALTLALLLASGPAWAGSRPEWWPAMAAEAARDGYQLTDEARVRALLDHPHAPIILDVRPDYEFERGRLPGAVNLEFHLGDRLELKPDKARRFRELLGSDPNRPVVIYCRSFRCLRSGIAAAWAARLGYTQVLRLPNGYYGWLEFTGQPLPDAAPGLRVGDDFPSCRLVVLDGDEDRAYLGLPEGAKAFSPGEMSLDYLLVELYQELCLGCLEAVPEYNLLVREIAADAYLRDRLRLIGLGVGSQYREVRRFRREHQVAFPLFADTKRDLFHCLGEPTLPVSYLLKRQPGGRMRIKAIFSGPVGDHEILLRSLKAAMLAPAP